MSVVKHFIEDSIKKTEIDEFLQNEFERAGYGGVSITKTPLGTHLVIYTMRPGLVIGRGGETIRALAQVLEEKFQLPSPQISVAEIEIPELNAYVVASRIASALKRGVHYRRAGFWGLTQTMEAGALGAEIIISGKLRTDRARYEKFKTGYLPKSGDPPRKYMRKAELHVQTKPGILGVKVRLIPPDAQFPDQVKVQIVEEELEPETAIMEEPIVTKESSTETGVLPPEEIVPVEETPVPSVEEKVVPEEKVAEPEVPKVEEKPVAEEPTVEPEAASAKTKKKVEPEANKTVVVEKKKKTTKKKVSKPKAPEKKAAEPKVSTVKEETPAKRKPAKKKVTKPKASETEEKAAPKKKVAKSKAAPVKEKKTSKKKVVKPKAASAKTKKEAEK
jgi:small subunit ribosomal protein S3